jgi:hypothetical protein
MRELQILIVPTATGVRLGATDGERTTLSASLPMPSHARALPTLLEALGRFHPLPIRAVLVAGGPRASYATRLYPGWFPDFGADLYELEIARRQTRPERGSR